MEHSSTVSLDHAKIVGQFDKNAHPVLTGGDYGLDYCHTDVVEELGDSHWVHLRCKSLNSPRFSGEFIAGERDTGERHHDRTGQVCRVNCQPDTAQSVLWGQERLSLEKASRGMRKRG